MEICDVVRRTQGRSPVPAESPAYLRVCGKLPVKVSILSLKKGRKWCMWVLNFLAKCGGIEPTLRSQIPVKPFHVPSGVNFCKVLNKRSFTLSISSPVQVQRTVLGLRCRVIGTNPLPLPTDLVFTFFSGSDRFGILRPV